MTAMSDNNMGMLGDTLGLVVIGRNEGVRLKHCFESLLEFDLPTIYVDSNSTDGSVSLAKGVSFAKGQGVKVLELDPSKPMSAARARREGFRQLLDEHPELEFVFFVDGDCQVDADWPAQAVDFLRQHKDVAAVCGRRREQHPEHSVYNRLCDYEWDTPIGEAQAVGGDAIYRCTAYREAGEFDASVPAGEEPELCKRLRDRSWKIWRLDAEMTVHDAAITQLGQWWKRQFRTGYAGYDVERRFQLGIFDRNLKSACFWGLCVPLFAILAAVALAWFAYGWWAFACLSVATLVVLLQTLRIARRTKSQNHTWKHSLQFGFFTMASKVPIILGVVRQILETALGKQARLVEYKTAESLAPQPKL